LFKTKAIILSIDTIRDNNIRIVCLTEEYGKISCWYKKKVFSHDIGDIVFMSIERLSWINVVKYTENIYSPREENWSFQKIYIFLESLSLIGKLLPEAAPYGNIFNDYKSLLSHMQEIHTLWEHHYLLFQFRILRTLWYIWYESVERSSITGYIYKNILSTPLEKVFASKELTDMDFSIIRVANQEAVHKNIS